MSRSDSHTHRVCTPGEALELIAEKGEIWVSDCICRKGSSSCAHDRVNVCLEFVSTKQMDRFNTREITPAEAAEIVEYARNDGLVLRPWADHDGNVNGICTCCECCCTFSMLHPDSCEKGRKIESTVSEYCAGCAQCVDACRFGARRVIGPEIVINRSKCFGCGLCAEACPVDGVRLVTRTGAREESQIIRRAPAASILNQQGMAKSCRPPV